MALNDLQLSLFVVKFGVPPLGGLANNAIRKCIVISHMDYLLNKAVKGLLVVPFMKYNRKFSKSSGNFRKPITV